MKKLIVLVLIAIGVNPLFAQVKETRSLSSFSGVKVSQGINVYLKKGGSEQAVVQVSGGGDIEDVKTEVSGGKLRIYLDNMKGRNNHIEVFVTYKELNSIAASSASDVYSDGEIESNSLEIHASSAANVEVKIKANKLEVHTSSAADIELEGKADDVVLHASSAGEIDAFDLVAKKVEAHSSSGADIRVSVEEEFTGRASSGGSVKYRGNPKKANTDSSSGGSVRKSH